MTTAPPDLRFLHAFAGGVLGEDSAAVAAEALCDVLSTQKSLVLEVHFTGFTRGGAPLGDVDARLLRAASRCIILRINRLGFTAHADEDALTALFAVFASSPQEISRSGVVERLQERGVRGVYLSTSTGEVYRPPPAGKPAPLEKCAPAEHAAPPEAAAPAEHAPNPVSTNAHAAGTAGSAIPGTAPAAEERRLSEFDLVDVSAPPTGLGRGKGRPAPPPPRLVPEEVPSDDLYHFFRTASGSRGSREGTEGLVQALHAADSVNRYNELVQGTLDAATECFDSGEEARGVGLLEALVTEAQREDRTRMYRDAAVQGMRRVATEQLLQRLAELLPGGVPLRGGLLRVLVFIGGDALTVAEGVAFRTGDAELRETIFRALLEVDPRNRRMLDRAMTDPVVTRTRTILELAFLPGLDPALPQHWAERAAMHPDAAVRLDVVRGAARIGGRTGLRLLLDRLADEDHLVRRTAICTLGETGDPAAVPFLSRILADSGDDDLQLETVGALGRIAALDALPVLIGILQKRQLFGGRKLLRLKLAAVAAISRLPGSQAGETLQGVADGKDAELADAARRALDARR